MDNSFIQVKGASSEAPFFDFFENTKAIAKRGRKYEYYT